MAENEKGETERLNQLLNQGFTIAFKHKMYPKPLWVKRVQTEKELVESLGAKYLRTPIADHMRPTDQQVDALVTFFKNMPKGTWVHYHCSAGRGRTTTLLAMIDMMKNAQKETLKQIIARQALHGGIDLLNPPMTEWKREVIEDRSAFARKFYQYCVENPNFDISWSEWLQKEQG